jgi:hypothetical protein
MNIVVGIKRPKYMYFLEFYFMEKMNPLLTNCDDIDILDTDSSIFFNKHCQQGQKSIVVD